MIDSASIVTADGSNFDPADYEVVLRPLAMAEGGGWLATIPALPGCIGDGETEMEALADVRLAAIEWAHAAVMNGEVLPIPSRGATLAAE